MSSVYGIGGALDCVCVCVCVRACVCVGECVRLEVVVMLSVDPARVTPERLSQYVPYFHPDFLGVTGAFESILSVTQRLNAPFRKVTASDGSYQMEHSANVALMNPRGDYHGFFRAPLDIPKMRVTLRSAQYLWDH